MSDKINRREQILEVAAALFVEQGYHATSVRQIAEKVGCTDAALYYHFKEGKRELFSAVVESNLPNLWQALEDCQHAPSFAVFTACFGREVAKLMPLKSDRFRWMIAEFPRLDADERALVHSKFVAFHQRMSEILGQYVSDRCDADSLAWMVTVAHLGYAQLFINLDLQSVASFEVARLDQLLGRLVKE